ncbi:MAG: hypothetical protein JO326_00940, partial [Acetobacteraceae bacterium]|nr:hypothetical protein [Acetobacteraceae bacterium]
MATTFNVSGGDSGIVNGNTGGSLSSAIAQINASPASGGPYVINLTGDVLLSGELPPILNSVTINGNGYTIEGEPGGGNRLFIIGTDQASQTAGAGSILATRQQVSFNDVNLANGTAIGGTAVQNLDTGGGGGLGAGGALFVDSTADVSLSGVTFSGAEAVGGAGSSGVSGGGGGLGGAGGLESQNGAGGGGGGGIFGPGGGTSDTGSGGSGGGGVFGQGGNSSIEGSPNSGVGSGQTGGGGGGGFTGTGGLATEGGGSPGTLSVSGLTGTGGAGQAGASTSAGG